MKMRIPVGRIKKGDRFFNQYWNEEVIAVTPAYRLDGTLDPDYSVKNRKPKIAVCSQDPHTGEWKQIWWMLEVGITSPYRHSMGVWSATEYEYIEVERDEAQA